MSEILKKAEERVNVLSIKLSGVPLPWASKVKHLRTMLELDNSMKVDMCQKNHWQDTVLVTRIQLCGSPIFYEFSLWDIFSKDCGKLFKSWNMVVKQVFYVHRCSHRT